ncbi:phytanoyl-CoA dioxygenase family protein [Leptolyngbya sp. AN02str]|uniref:phytanoyl-CoA dioxygenase family protein n=1 Tax=Leptolyngbya sp. AN02str TaxID=3423363 RepID=UPI003D310753
MVQHINRSVFSPADLDQLAADLNRDGICIIRGLFDRALIDEWKVAFDALFAERQQRPGGIAPRGTARGYITLPWVAPFANPAVFANPTILDVLNRVFYQEYKLVQLAADIPMQGSEYQQIHRDFRPLFTDHIVTPLYALAVNFPLVEVNANNGPFEMARGTHVMPRDEALIKIRAGEIAMEQFYLQPGDVMVRSPLALHRGTPNYTPHPRPMIVMGYVMHWLHTHKVDLTLEESYYNQLAPQLQQLLRCQTVNQLSAQATETYTNFEY